MIVFILDTSLTIEHFPAFEKAWQAVVNSAQDGDTIVLAVVKGDARGSDYGEFPYQKMETMPCSGIQPPSQYAAKREAVISSLKSAFATAVSSDRPKKTLLFSSIRSAAKFFGGHTGPRILIVASDGLEDSEVANFERTTVAGPTNQKLIAGQINPDLKTQMKGASVWYVAAGVRSDKKWMELQAFWLAYFKALGSELPSHRYAGTLLQYPH